jgi:hypothetical protein
MDTYLPADFRELHDAAAEDWRDVSSSSWMPRAQPSAVETRGGEGHALAPADACADPLWRVI